MILQNFQTATGTTSKTPRKFLNRRRNTKALPLPEHQTTAAIPPKVPKLKFVELQLMNDYIIIIIIIKIPRQPRREEGRDIMNRLSNHDNADRGKERKGAKRRKSGQLKTSVDTPFKTA